MTKHLNDVEIIFTCNEGDPVSVELRNRLGHRPDVSVPIRRA